MFANGQDLNHGAHEHHMQSHGGGGVHEHHMRSHGGRGGGGGGLMNTTCSLMEGGGGSKNTICSLMEGGGGGGVMNTLWRG